MTQECPSKYWPKCPLAFGIPRFYISGLDMKGIGICQHNLGFTVKISWQPPCTPSGTTQLSVQLRFHSWELRCFSFPSVGLLTRGKNAVSCQQVGVPHKSLTFKDWFQILQIQNNFIRIRWCLKKHPLNKNLSRQGRGSENMTLWAVISLSQAIWKLHGFYWWAGLCLQHEA